MEIPKEVLDAQKKWRRAHGKASKEISELFEGKRHSVSSKGTEVAQAAILELSELADKHRIPILTLFPEHEERDTYERHLLAARSVQRAPFRR